MAIFLDASLFCAYKNKDDIHHEDSIKIVESIQNRHHGEPVTTDYIFDEVVSVLLRKAGKTVAIDVGDLILNSGILMFCVDKMVFEAALKIFQSAEGLSFTDCTNVAFMQLFGIEKIATFDKGFLGVKGIVVIGK